MDREIAKDGFIFVDTYRAAFKGLSDDPRQMCYSTRHMQRRKDGRMSIQVAFYIGYELYREARLRMGDRVIIGVDSRSGTGILRRIEGKELGYKFGPDGKGNGKSKTPRGRLHITVFNHETLPHVPHRCRLESVTVDEESIIFAFPQHARWDAIT